MNGGPAFRRKGLESARYKRDQSTASQKWPPELAARRIDVQRSAPQRLLTLAAGRRTHADWHQAVMGPGDRRWLEWRLYEVLRP